MILKSLSGEVKDAHCGYRRAAKQNHPLASRIIELKSFSGKWDDNPNIGERLERAAKLGDDVAIEKLSTYCLEQNRTIEAIAWHYFLKGLSLVILYPHGSMNTQIHRLRQRNLRAPGKPGKPPLYNKVLLIIHLSTRNYFCQMGTGMRA